MELKILFCNYILCKKRYMWKIMNNRFLKLQTYKFAIVFKYYWHEIKAWQNFADCITCQDSMTYLNLYLLSSLSLLCIVEHVNQEFNMRKLLYKLLMQQLTQKLSNHDKEINNWTSENCQKVNIESYDVSIRRRYNFNPFSK